MAVTQTNREIEITTPLGPDVLLLRDMYLTEELGRLFTINLKLDSTEDIDFEALLGQNVTIRLDQPKGKRYFNGYVGSISQAFDQGRYAVYEATVHPWLWFLTRTADCRIFQKKTVPDIIKQVFSELGFTDFKDRLCGSYRTWDYCVQYRETDFNFVSRLMEQEGIYYYFTHEKDKHIFVFADALGSHDIIPGHSQILYYPPDQVAVRNEECIYDWYFSKRLQPGTYVLNEYNPLTPKADLKADSNIQPGHSRSGYEVYDYPGDYLVRGEGNTYARTRIEELHAQYEQFQGQSNVVGLLCGGLFTLSNYPRADQNHKYLVVSVSHSIQTERFEARDGTGQTVYTNSFNVIKSETQYRPERITPKSIVQGLQTALVVGPPGEEIHTDEHGRVKLQFYWDRYGKKDENSSCWIRVSQVHAGKGFGGIDIPRIGEEVIVLFEEGDPDRPIVTGRVYNADNKAPNGLPAAKMVSGLKSNSTPGGGGNNAIMLDDTKGKEKITIHGQYDMNTTVEHDQTNTVKNDFTETIKNNAMIEVTLGTYNHAVKTGTATYLVQGALTEIYNTTQVTKVNSDINVSSTSGNITIKADSGEILIDAAKKITLHTGASQITMESNGNITIAGTNIKISGDTVVASGTKEAKIGVGNQNASFDPGKAAISGAAINSSATGTHEITGALVKIN